MLYIHALLDVLGIEGPVVGLIIDTAIVAGSQVEHIVGRNSEVADSAVRFLTIHIAQQAGEGHLGLDDGNTGSLGGIAVRQHGGKQSGNSVTLGGSPVDGSGHQNSAVSQNLIEALIVLGLLLGNLGITNLAGAVNIVGAVSIVNEASLLQQLNSLLGVVVIVVDLLFNVGLGSHGESGAVRTMHYAAPALAEGLSKLNTIQQIGDRLTELGELGRTKVAGKAEVTVTGAVILGGGAVDGTGLDEVHNSVNLRAISDLGIDLDLTGGDHIHNGIFGGLNDNQLLDTGLLTLEVAVVVLVYFQNDLAGALIEADEVVGACGNTVTGGKTSSLNGFTNGFSGELLAVGIYKVNALAVILNRPALAEPVGEVNSLHGGISNIIVVRQIRGLAILAGLGDGDGEGLLIVQTYRGKNIGLAVTISQTAGQHVIGSGNNAHLLACRRGNEHSPSYEVLGSNSFAVVELQAVIDDELEGNIAVLLLDALIGLNDGLVDSIVTVLITIDGSHIIGQCHNRLIGGIGVSYESGIGPVAGSFGRSTDNNLTVSFLLALAAGYHGKNHDYSEQQSQKLFHVAISSLNIFVLLF